MEILKREIEKLKKKQSIAQANLNDTGFDRYYNSVSRYEKQISEIEKLIASGERIALIEHEHSDLLSEIKDKAENLRLDFPHDDGLLLFLNWLEERIEI